jgi:hypothetical protein
MPIPKQKSLILTTVHTTALAIALAGVSVKALAS